MVELKLQCKKQAVFPLKNIKHVIFLKKAIILLVYVWFWGTKNAKIVPKQTFFVWFVFFSAFFLSILEKKKISLSIKGM